MALLALFPIPADASDEPARIYAAKCQTCHGKGGDSPFPELSLVDDKWLHGSSVPEITRVIEDGVPGKAMASFKPQLTKAEIGALARYVRSLSKKGKAERGVSGK